MGEAIVGSEAVLSGAVTRGQLRWNYRPIFPDVYVPRDIVPLMPTRAAGAWLWSRRRGVITGRAAAALHGAKWVADDAPVELIWTNNHTPRGIIARRERIAADEMCPMDRMYIAAPPRAAVDLGRHLRLTPAVIYLDSLARATGLTSSDVRPLIERYTGTKGIRNCRQAVDLMDGGAQSPKETWLRLLLIDAGFPQPQTQIPLYENGYPVAYLDMGWREIKVSVEYDGDQHRTDRPQYVKDIRRAELVDDRGWLNVRVVAEDRGPDIIARVMRAWRKREREGMVVKLPAQQPGMLFRGKKCRS